MVLPAYASAQEGSSGIVEEIRGIVTFRQKPGAATVRLNSNIDLAKRLYHGQQVRCQSHGELRLLLNGKPKRITGPSSWFTIPPRAFNLAVPIQRALDEYGRISGRDRGEQTSIFSPSAHSVVIPDRFAIRWVPDIAKCILSFSIYEPDGVKVWSKDDVDGTTGLLESEESKKALKKYRTESGQGPLTLRLTDSCANNLSVTFSLISMESEASLKEELKFWDDQNGPLLTHLGRASVYERYRMFPQAADEYEAGLKNAPESRDLLIRTILAHRNTGNQVRELELSKRLPPGTAIP